MNVDYKLIGMRIRQARKSKGLTQEKLAEELNVSNVYISQIENGRTSLNLEHLSKLSFALDSPAEYILQGTNRLDSTYLRNEIVALLQECTPEQIRLITELIRVIKKHS